MIEDESKNYFQDFSKFLNFFFYHREGEAITKEIIQGCCCKHKDDRIEFYELQALFLEFIKREGLKKTTGISGKDWTCYFSKIERNVQSVVMIVPSRMIEEDKNCKERVVVKSISLNHRRISNDKHKICNNFFYANQASVHPSGTGFFIEKNVIASAAHVVLGPAKNLADFRFISGVIMKEEDSFETQITVPKSNVYEAVDKLIASSDHQQSYYSDWIVLKVKPSYPSYSLKMPMPVIYTERNPRAIWGKTKKEKVYAIGHGLGLPMKISFGGEIIKICQEEKYFECTTTLLEGNSGSPVFYADTHELAGIYMRGINKWAWDSDNNCVRIRNHQFLYEGQECQMLEPIRKNLQA